MTEVLIRKAQPEDLVPVTRMFQDSVRDVYGPHLGLEAVDHWARGDAARGHFETMLPQAVVAEACGQIVGVAGLGQNGLDVLWVATEWRRQGVGARLLERAEQMLREQGWHRGSLECLQGNQNAMRFYLRMGWQVVKEYRDPEKGGAVMVQFNKKL